MFVTAETAPCDYFSAEVQINAVPGQDPADPNQMCRVFWKNLALIHLPPSLSMVDLLSVQKCVCWWVYFVLFFPKNACLLMPLLGKCCLREFHCLRTGLLLKSSGFIFPLVYLLNIIRRAVGWQFFSSNWAKFFFFKGLQLKMCLHKLIERRPWKWAFSVVLSSSWSAGSLEPQMTLCPLQSRPKGADPFP